MTKEYSNKVFHKDSRKILRHLPEEEIVDTTITSPPYFDMKDYGSKNQIGFGQTYESYMQDLQIVFTNIFKITKVTGSLWIVIDTFKKDGRVIPLPFDLVSKLTEIGWLLQDIIVWKKDKTVPWSGKGFSQRKFEYILFFSKGKHFKYNKDKVRLYDTDQLKKWWVKYPERYNPKGKALDEVWEFPIPTQGSWGDKYIKHFCPLPKDMVATMIQLTTEEGDIVVDPFSGSGAVLAQAAFMNRKYIGFELNKEYINMSKNYIKNSIKEGNSIYNKTKGNSDQAHFEDNILNLRALKFGRVLKNKLKKNIGTKIPLLYVKRVGSSNQKNKLIKVEYIFINENKFSERQFDLISFLISKAPLSKFGVEAIFRDLKTTRSIKNDFYGYTSTNSYSNSTVNIIKQNTTMISEIKVDFNQNDY